MLQVSEEAVIPIAVNLETGEDTSRAVFPAPRSWTQDRLRAWAAASTPMPTEDR